MAKILVVDDDRNILASVAEFLSAENHIVETATCGKDGLQLLKNFQFDVVIMDWRMPDISGIEVVKEFRRLRGNTPIIFLTGESQVEKRLEGFDSGADDYMTKPFHLKELSARLKAILRRPRGLIPDQNTVGNITLIEGTRTVNLEGKTVNLGKREFAVLEFLIRYPNRAHSTKDLLRAIWPSDAEATEDAVRVCVNSLRKKITGADGDCIVKTILGSGYIVETEPS